MLVCKITRILERVGPSDFRTQGSFSVSNSRKICETKLGFTVSNTLCVTLRNCFENLK